MQSSNKMQDTSTPKRRRLNTRNRGKSKLIVENSEIVLNCSPISSRVLDNETNNGNRCESPYLPCNQVEFLNDSGNNSSTSDILGQACLDLENDKWESLAINTSKINDICDNEIPNSLEIIEEVSEDMFRSKLDQSMFNCEEKKFAEGVEKSFDVINESISKLHELKNKSSLFETKDSFLLDVRTSAEECLEIETNKLRKPNEDVPKNSYYGLPFAAKELFKTYRNIEKFYDWQEECLNLGAIKQRNNLIYALPTSGGKTLVAEVLMMREVLNRKKNAMFILPFVAIVQEKIWSLSPFAVQLDFLVEEYTGGKGHIPPKKRRNKNSIYIATIEKGLALVRSLIELGRLHEIGLIVVDELHLIGEKGRGGTLETLLSTVIFTNQDIQIVGMSATIGNLDQIATFLKAEVFQRQFRPVELKEYVKLGDMLHRIVWSEGNMEVVPHRQLVYEYSPAAVTLDPDLLGGLVSEVVPEGSCLVFCPTKRNCENVATLLCKLQRREMTSHRSEERKLLEQALKAEGASVDIYRNVRYGVAFHHAGLASDERTLLEHAFRTGVISVICCTSTLAAGVNLPASRVVIRAPLVGREALSLATYRQMTGRAGRAGVCDIGESIVICSPREWPQLHSVLQGGLAPARSVLRQCVGGLLLSAVALNIATSRPTLRDLLGCTLMAVTEDDSSSDIKTVCDDSLRELLQSGALEVINKQSSDTSHLKSDTCVVYNDSELLVSKLGKAAITGCMDISTAKQLLDDLEVASLGLVLMGSLHLLYLVSPHDHAGLRPDYRHYYSLYCSLDEEGVQTAKVLGITEVNAIRMMTGKPIVNVPERVLCRFYLALMLHDLWKQLPVPDVAFKYCVPRGTVQSVLSSACSFASCAARFCAASEALWSFAALLQELAPRLLHCAAPELQALMELPSVKKARALQLMRAGYKRVEDLAKTSVDELVSSVSHISRTAANQLISAARMMLIEKVENLRAEAEDVMEELKI